MAIARIPLPEKLGLEELFHFSRVLDGYKGYEKIYFDCGLERYFPPFSLLFLSAKIRSFKNQNLSTKIEFINELSHGYAAHMHFFSMCGHRGDIQKETDDSGKRYISITSVRYDQLIDSPTDKFAETGDLVQRHADKISRMIVRDELDGSDIFDVLSYSIREIFRNVFEHSGAGELFYCAQYWPQRNKVEVSISDLGIGIRKGLGLNPNFRFSTDKEAIENSLLPGVSGKTHLPRQSETWFNSGYGLYMTHRLARHGGNFVIASGNSAISLSANSKRNYLTSFEGTAIRLNFDVDRIGDVKERLSEFREDGIKIAAQIKGSGGRPPSAMSLLLRRDFR
jgi:anti-sigma regulatory factor (Ser/Thr protein kinase)